MPTCATCKRDYPPGEKFCPEDGTALPAEATPPDPRLGLTIGNYQITQKLGEGGMGAVYKASHPRIGREAAIKFLHPECAARPDVVERFFDEAMAANRINHPNIIEISDSGSLPDGASYLVMELLSGRDLKAFLKEKGTLSLEQFQRIFVQVAGALGAAHEKGIVHRDLKPENIFLCQRDGRDDFVKLVDFGIAKLSDLSGGLGKTKTGMLMGTPAYMSPEQAMGKKDLDHRSDIYALGIIFYECLSGAPPFRADSFGEILIKHATEPPVPLREFAPQKHIPPALDVLVQRCLEKEPGRRPASMREVLEAIQSPATYQAGQAPLPATMGGRAPTTPGHSPSFPPHLAQTTAPGSFPPMMPPPGAPPPGGTPLPYMSPGGSFPPTMPGGTPPPYASPGGSFPPAMPGAAPPFIGVPGPPGSSTYLVDKSPLAQRKAGRGGMKPLHLILSAIVLIVGFAAMVAVMLPDSDETEDSGGIFSLPGLAPPTDAPTPSDTSSYPQACQTLKKRICGCSSLAAGADGANLCQMMQTMESAFRLAEGLGEDTQQSAEEMKATCEEMLLDVESVLQENGC